MAINSERYLFGITIMGSWRSNLKKRKWNTTEVLLKSRFILEGAKVLKTN